MNTYAILVIWKFLIERNRQLKRVLRFCLHQRRHVCVYIDIFCVVKKAEWRKGQTIQQETRTSYGERTTVESKSNDVIWYDTACANVCQYPNRKKNLYK